jgi:hypothetical protein
MKYNKEDFIEMIKDRRVDNAPEYDKLEIGETEINEDSGEWEAIAKDEKSAYLLTDDGTGNIIINYIGTR